MRRSLTASNKGSDTGNLAHYNASSRPSLLQSDQHSNREVVHGGVSKGLGQFLNVKKLGIDSDEGDLSRDDELATSRLDDLQVPTGQWASRRKSKLQVAG